MKRGFVLRRIAEREFDDSIAYYEKQRPGLGQEFRATIEQLFQAIADNPERFRNLGGDVHRAVVTHRFPFVIHFLIEPERIVVLSVFHASRDPKQLKFRR
jgi:plasmid stabilization system protein ParE